MIRESCGGAAAVLALLYGMILLTLAYRIVTGRRRRKISREYLEKLYGCLRPEDHLPCLRFDKIDSRYRQEVLLDLIRHLTGMIRGVEKRILLLIFHTNDLLAYLLRECRYGNDRKRIRAIFLYSSLEIHQSFMGEIVRYIHSRNRELRMVTLLAWLNMEPGKIMDKLIGYPHPLSEREYANIYSLINRHCLPMEQAVVLLGSTNPTVVRFGKMLIKKL